MEVTNALIDKCSELWLKGALEHGLGPNGFYIMREIFLTDYLRAKNFKDAKTNFNQAAWNLAYYSFHMWIFGVLPSM